MFRRSACAVALAVMCAGPAAAQTLPRTDPAVLGAGAESYVQSRERAYDQHLHPDYQQRKAPAYARAAQDNAAVGTMLDFWTDPYVLEDGPRRADWRTVQFPNRYGAELFAQMIAPRAGRSRHPAVVILTGGGSGPGGYLNLAQGLAEAGYVALVVASQGDAHSGARPADPVPSTPENEYCRPHDHDSWQAGAPGVPENGECAGMAGPAGLGPDALVGAQISQGVPEGLDTLYVDHRARKAHAAIDAARWLTSDANPWHRRIDPKRMAVAGHSLGAHGALVAANLPGSPFDAAVSWDGFGRLPSQISPRVPTMFHHHEARVAGPRYAAPPAPLPGHDDAERFRREGVDTMVVSLAGSTHQEWNYLPYTGLIGLDPTAAEFATASRRGERVALHYTLAWLDRSLGRRMAQRREATDDLLTRTFDDRVDAHAIGQGRWDPATRRNVPYTIAGRTATQQLSPFYGSAAYFGDVDCPDLRKGCS